MDIFQHLLHVVQENAILVLYYREQGYRALYTQTCLKTEKFTRSRFCARMLLLLPLQLSCNTLSCPVRAHFQCFSATLLTRSLSLSHIPFSIPLLYFLFSFSSLLKLLCLLFSLSLSTFCLIHSLLKPEHFSPTPHPHGFLLAHFLQFFKCLSHNQHTVWVCLLSHPSQLGSFCL